MYVHNIYRLVVSPSSSQTARFLPLAPLDFQVLTLLAAGELHGYGIVQASNDAFPEQPVLDVGSLYRIIARMLADRLVREVKAPADSPTDKRVRRYYAVTDLGRAVARAEAARLRALLTSPATLRLLRSAR
jgi:DNA-binding PadR family transcriptional regulator